MEHLTENLDSSPSKALVAVEMAGEKTDGNEMPKQLNEASGDKTDGNKLPKRLFATGHYPIRRLNIYSKLDIICFVEAKLHDTEELRMIKTSQFGRLFKLPASQCATSCKIIQAMMARQVKTNKKHEMWTVFAGKPLRFSILEFEALTGLLCGKFPRSYYSGKKKVIDMGEGSVWQRFIGNTEANLSDIGDMLANDPEMPGWRKLGLALILIVDGVLVASLQKHRPTAKYVEMLANIDEFFRFPWGRESFLNTISSLIPSKEAWGRSEEDFAAFTRLMLQKTLTVKGFPQVLQLLAYKSIPRLLEELPNRDDNKKLMEVSISYLQKSLTLTKDEIWDIEHDENVVVQPVIPLEGRYQDQWDDELQDSSVNYLLKLIRQKHCFTVDEWLDGDKSEAKNVRRQKKIVNQNTSIVGRSKGKRPVEEKVELRPRKAIKKRVSNRKQTKIGAYFRKSEVTIEEVNRKADSNELRIQKLEAELKEVKARADKYERLFKERRKVHFGKLSSQKRLLCRRKKTTSTSKSGEKEKVYEDSECTPKVFEYCRTSSPKGTERSEDSSYSLVRREKPKATLAPQKLDYSPTFAIEPPPHIKIQSIEITNTIKEADKSGECSKCLVRKKRSAEIDPCVEVPPLPDLGGSQPKGNTDEEVGNEIEIQTTDTPIKVAGSAKETDDSGDCSYSLVRKKRSTKLEPAVEMGEQITDERSMAAEEIQPQTLLQNIDTLDAEVCHPAAEDNIDDGNAASIPMVVLSGDDNTSKECVDGTDADEVDVNTMDVAVGSPPKKKSRRLANPYEKTICEMLKRNREKRPRESCELFPSIDTEVYEMLFISMQSVPKRLHRPLLGPDFTNQTLLDIATPQNWIESTHMEILMGMLGRLHRRVLAKERSRFISPWFINLVYSTIREFKRAKDRRRIKWSQNMKAYVKNEDGEWLVDVDTVYIPMSLGNKHWVGLVINFKLSSIEVLDSDCDNTTDARLRGMLNHLCEALPHVLKTFCRFEVGVNLDDKPFTISRTLGLYKNERGGDCGPVALKFMEMHLYSSSHEGMASLDDKMVDRFRKQYVVDVFADVLMPMYG